MRTTTLFFVLVSLLFANQIAGAQGLSKEVKKSTVEIGKTFTDISIERLKMLDQVAFSIFKSKSSKPEILFIDHNNGDYSQLAMVWLRTGLAYYGHSDWFSVKSAGISEGNTNRINLKELEKFGFKVTNGNNKQAISYRVDYGSGNWEIYQKNIRSLTSDNSNILKIYVENNILRDNEANSLEVLFKQTNDIPKEMLYVATRINNLMQTKQQ